MFKYTDILSTQIINKIEFFDKNFFYDNKEKRLSTIIKFQYTNFFVNNIFN